MSASTFRAEENIHKLLLLVTENSQLTGTQISSVQPPYRHEFPFTDSIRKLSLVTKNNKKHSMVKCIQAVGSKGT